MWAKLENSLSCQGTTENQLYQYCPPRKDNTETSLLRRLQVQTLPDEAPPMAKIHPFSKIAITFEPVV